VFIRFPHLNPTRPRKKHWKILIFLIFPISGCLLLQKGWVFSVPCETERVKVDKARKNLRATLKPPSINVKLFRVPFNIWKVMGGQNYWRAPHFITSLKTILAKIPQNLCCISILESIFSSQCTNWLCAFFPISKLKDSVENSLN